MTTPHRIAPVAAAALLAAFALLSGAAPQARADVLGFDDLSPGAFVSMPATYRGFSFAGWFHSDFEYPDGDPGTPWSPYQPSSGVINVFTDFADPANPLLQDITIGPAIRSATPFIFHGAHVSGYSPVTFVLTLAGVEVHRSQTMPLATGADGNYAFLASGYAGNIDGVAIEGVQGYFALDDFSFTASPVPEPSSLALGSAGLAIALFVRRRRSAMVSASSSRTC